MVNVMDNDKNSGMDNKSTKIARLMERRTEAHKKVLRLDGDIRRAEHQQKEKEAARARKQDDYEKATLGGIAKAVNLDRFRLRPDCVDARAKHNLDIALITGALLHLSDDMEKYSKEDIDQLRLVGRAYLQTRPRDRVVPGRMKNPGSIDSDEIEEMYEHDPHDEPTEQA